MGRRYWLTLVVLTGCLACELIEPEPEPEPDPGAGVPDPGPAPGGSDDPPGPPASGEPPLPDNGYCRPVSDSPAAHAALERQILEQTNAIRARGANCGGRAYPPVGALTMHPALRCAARAHSKDMVDRKFFDHTNPSGEGPTQRVAKTGFASRAWGENIAAGEATADETMQQWVKSAGHCVNLMNADFRQLGVGYHPGGSYRHYWTQVFGTMR